MLPRSGRLTGSKNRFGAAGRLERREGGGIMSQELKQYSGYFKEGVRVRVGVPLDGGGAFREWGVVAWLDGDLLQLDLSRDCLPEHARLEVGRTLELGLSGQEGNLVCRGVLVADDEAKHRLQLRLVEEVSPYEPREYFRQDVYLPLIYRLPFTQIPQDVKLRWEESRREMEFAAQSPEPGEPEELEDSRREIRARLEKRKGAAPVAANISGGGVRLNIDEQLKMGQLVELGIYLPHPARMIELVGEVVEVTPLPDQVRYSTALRYRFIDEADRDRLIGYISVQQLLQLSQHGPRGAAPPQSSGPAWRRQMGVVLCIVLIAAAGWFLARSIVVAKERGVKWEVQRVFDEGFMEFLRRQR